MTNPPQNYGFFRSLFDFSFHHYVTTKIIRIVYVIGIVAIALACLVFALSGFIGPTGSIWAGIGLLVAAPFLFLLLTISMRIYLELIIAVLQIAENTTPPDRR